MTRNLQLTKEQIASLLLEMVNYALSVEKQRGMPRYGWKITERIIKPSEIYDESRARVIINWLPEIQDAAYAFLKSLDMEELNDVLERMRSCSRKS